MKKEPNVYMTLKGPPGTGKSFLISEVRQFLMKMGIDMEPTNKEHCVKFQSGQVLKAFQNMSNTVQEDKPQWKHYTVGFCFNRGLTKVLLIKKAKPAWQAGRFNGVGGSFEHGEDAVKCMEREFKEEVNWMPIYTFNHINWIEFAQGEVRCHQGDCFLHYMTGISEEEFYPTSTNNEIPQWIDVENLPIDVVPNLHFLVPMARNVFNKVWWSEKATFRTLI